MGSMSTPAAPSDSSPSPSPASTSLLDDLRAFARWARANPTPTALLVGIIGTLIWFYSGYKPLTPFDPHSFWRWGLEAWNDGNDLEHGPLILPGAIVVAWLQRETYAQALKRSSWAGLGLLLFGILIFVFASWTQQGRYAFVALPILINGIVCFLWGAEVGRIALLPCLLLLFMVPLGFLLGHTEPLQQFVAVVVTGISNLVGIGVNREGVNLIARDNSFQCQVAGGCSGVRSIMAMTMLSLLYVYFYEKRWWKRAAIFAMTLPLTLVGNIVRVFTIVLVSKWFGQAVGTGPWHDISGFIITIPIAVGAMVGVHELLNIDLSKYTKRLLQPAPAARSEVKPAAKEGEDKPASSSAPASPISYDY